MNKAFVREPEFDGKAYCPQCGSLGTSVGEGPLQTHVPEECRDRLGESAWFCGYARCSVAYFNLFEATVGVDELTRPVYPKNADVPVCACFGFRVEDIEDDAHEDVPHRIRDLLKKSQSDEARCATLAADGQCCMREVQRLYFRLRGS